jgi:hypothetical protein
MDFFETDPFSIPVDDLLERNLDALARMSPKAAAQIRAVSPRPDIEFFESEENVLSATIDGGRLLASRRKPLTEAARLADTVDIAETAGVAVTGFGLGYHLRLFAERMNKTGVLLCFEPDLELLRAVFEKIDCTEWMLRTNFALLTDADDSASITQTLGGLEGIIALGVRIVDHPPSRDRLGDSAVRFGQSFTDVLKAIRTAIVTTLVQSEVTLRNLLMNLDHYSGCDGISDLASSCLGMPAVVVSAGPSLERNIDVLAQPGVRDRVVIIAVQTVLKTLLNRGIRPHFVCALDHHEISTRFYEGLTQDDVRGVTLVVEPKANAAILDAWPGAIRSLGNDLLDLVMDHSGVETGPKGEFAPGATVAHLCYYLARYLGCDPVLLCGQDLAFTDGQYYADGAAIHDVWACELGPFNTLEMMEWERIAREKSLLRRKTDVFGRPIFTDEQMSTYLAQFESDFLADTERGLRIIDATEGGVVKRHTVPMSLADTIEAYGSPIPVSLPETTRYTPDADTLAKLRSRILVIRADTRNMLRSSKDTIRLLKKLRRSTGDQARANDLVRRIHEIRDEVTTLGAAFRMTQFINQSGTLSRVRADRAIDLETTGDEHERQKLRIDRDIANVQAIVSSSERLIDLLDAAAGTLDGQPKWTRDRVEDADQTSTRPQRQRVAAMVHVDFERGGLGTTRDIESPVAQEYTPIRATIARLLAARRLREVICLTDDPGRLERALGELFSRVIVEPLDLARMRSRIDAIGSARRLNPAAWRGGIASLTCYDEVLEPVSCAAAMKRRDIDAAVLVGADWCLTDPNLIDDMIERHTECPAALRLVFSQAPPGLGSILIDRDAINTLAENAQSAGPFATVGAMLGYVPFAPQDDPITRPMCIPVSPNVRDLMLRCIPDSPGRRLLIAQVLERLDLNAGIDAIAANMASNNTPETFPELVEIEIHSNDLGIARNIVEQMEPGSTLTLRGKRVEDCDQLSEIVNIAHGHQVSIHVRTDLLGQRWESISESGADVVSVDVLAVNSDLYQQLTGSDEYETVKDRVEKLLARRNAQVAQGGLPTPWIVPRITRCDQAYEHIEPFYDGWLRACGCAVIDPPAERMPGARIAPLTLPARAAALRDQTELAIGVDGLVAGCDRLSAHGSTLNELWLRVLAARGIGMSATETTAQPAQAA